jgi:hypothetical protein
VASFSVPARTIDATEFVSAGVLVPAGLEFAAILMTSCPEWAPGLGWFSWAIEASFDGGLSWRRIAEQGYTDPLALRIGSPSRAGVGVLPTLGVGWGVTVPNARARARAKTDGAVLTCAFLVTTAP